MLFPFLKTLKSLSGDCTAREFDEGFHRRSKGRGDFNYNFLDIKPYAAPTIGKYLCLLLPPSSFRIPHVFKGLLKFQTLKFFRSR